MGKVTCSKCPKVFDSEIEYNLHWSHNHSGVASASLVQTEPVDVAVEVEPVITAEEPNYKDSQKIIGQLYPVLKSKDGQVIDGFHRLAVDPNWKSVVLSEVDTEEKLLIARAVSNWHRRQVPKKEKAKWINDLAEIYQKQGYKVEGQSKGSVPKNEIAEKIADVTGLSKITVINYLYNDYKQRKRTPDKQPQISAAERIEHELGKEYVERHRDEVKQELAEEATLSPEEKIKLSIEKQRKKAEQEQQAQVEKLEKEKKAQEKKLEKEAKRKECEVVKQRQKEEQKRKKEEERKQLEEKIRKEVVKRDIAEVKQELLKDPSFQREVLHEVDKAQIVTSTDPCPSGICQAPSTIDAGKPIDIKAEQLTRFFTEHPFCICKKCSEYSTCAVIR